MTRSMNRIRRNRRGNSKLRKKRRQALHARQDGKCYWCKRPLEVSEMTFDHIVPFRKVLSYALEYVVGACAACNRSRGSPAPKTVLSSEP